MSLKIDLGCGSTKPEGYFGIDRQKFKGVDLVCNINKKIPLKDNCASVIRAFDILEHVDSNKRIHIMEEIYRLLKHGGRLIAHIPDAEHGQGFFQDPTHYAAWCRNSIRYYTDPVYIALYGTKVNFKVIHQSITLPTNYGAQWLDWTLEAIKEPKMTSKPTLKFTGERMVGKTIEEVRAVDLNGRLHVERYEWATKYLKPGNILDCACGTGYGTRLIAEYLTGSNVDGFDVSQEALDYAEYYHKRKNITFQQQDMLKLNTDKKYSSIVSLESIEHVADPSIVLNSYKEMIEPGGIIIVSIPTILNLKFNKYHKFEVPNFEAASKYLYDQGFDILDSWHQENTYGIFALEVRK